MPFTKIDASNLGGTTLPALNGSALTNISAGKIGQVIGSNNAYGHYTTSTSYTDLLSASGVTWEISITPTATTSKVLFMCSLNIAKGANALQNSRGTVRFFEKIGSGSYTEFIQDYEKVGLYDYGGSGVWRANILAHHQLRSPNTTSTVTYKFDFRNNTGSEALYLNSDNRESDCILMEVLA